MIDKKNESFLNTDRDLSSLRDFVTSLDQVRSEVQIRTLEEQITLAMERLAETEPEKMSRLAEVFETILKLLHHKKQQFRYAESREKIDRITAGIENTNTEEQIEVFDVDPDLLDTLENPEKAIFLGEGAEATVRAVYSEKIGKVIACKQNRADSEGESSKLDRLRKEFEVSQKLQHPNIIKTYAFTERDGIGTIAIELLEGKNLELALYEEWSNFSKDDVADILRQYADAVQYLYDNNVINQDLSVQNVSYESGHITLFDFGLASTIDTNTAFGRRKLLDQTKKIAEVFVQIVCGGRNFVRKNPPLQNMLSSTNYGLLVDKLSESKIREIDTLLNITLGTHSATLQPQDFMKKFIAIISG